MSVSEYTCIVCPVSCRIRVEETSEGLKVSGNNCKRGERHAITEHTDPVRMLTTTVVLHGANFQRLPVISTSEVPKRLLKQCLKSLYDVEVSVPVHCGDVLVKDICGTGVDVIAARTVE